MQSPSKIVFSQCQHAHASCSNRSDSPSGLDTTDIRFLHSLYRYAALVSLLSKSGLLLRHRIRPAPYSPVNAMRLERPAWMHRETLVRKPICEEHACQQTRLILERRKRFFSPLIDVLSGFRSQDGNISSAFPSLLTSTTSNLPFRSAHLHSTCDSETPEHKASSTTEPTTSTVHYTGLVEHHNQRPHPAPDSFCP